VSRNLLVALEAFAVGLGEGMQHLHLASHFHTTDVAKYADMLAVAWGLSLNERTLLRPAALLHDVGKMAVLDTLLTMRGQKLARDSADWRRLQLHTRFGARILTQIASAYPKADIAAPIVAAALHHHEDWDGGGYPFGLAGRSIPLLARLLRIVDSYAAMTQPEREWRLPLNFEQALAELRRGQGKQYDPDLMDCFCESMERNAIEAI
jgi:response regulator RpfG family c-di-GMP phosphodiesterase